MNSGTGMALRVIAAVAILVIGGGAVLRVLGLISTASFKGLALQTALVGGVAAVVTVLLGILSGKKE